MPQNVKSLAFLQPLRIPVPCGSPGQSLPIPISILGWQKKDKQEQLLAAIYLGDMGEWTLRLQSATCVAYLEASQGQSQCLLLLSLVLVLFKLEASKMEYVSWGWAYALCRTLDPGGPRGIGIWRTETTEDACTIGRLQDQSSEINLCDFLIVVGIFTLIDNDNHQFISRFPDALF